MLSCSSLEVRRGEARIVDGVIGVAEQTGQPVEFGHDKAVAGPARSRGTRTHLTVTPYESAGDPEKLMFSVDCDHVRSDPSAHRRERLSGARRLMSFPSILHWPAKLRRVDTSV